jgi:hypothetical protein
MYQAEEYALSIVGVAIGYMPIMRQQANAALMGAAAQIEEYYT